MRVEQALTGTQLVAAAEELDALEAEWLALHERAPEPLPFTHPAWYRTWLRHFGAGTEPTFLALRDGERLAGVAALDLAQPGRAVQLGDYNVCDYSGPLVEPGFEAAVTAAICGWLAARGRRELSLWGIAADSAMRAGLAAGAARAGWTSVAEFEAVAPGADLPATFEEFVASLGKHDRHELRRKLRNLAAAGAVRFDTATSPGDVSARMDAFLQMMRISRGDKDEFLTGTMEAFFRDLAPTFAAVGMTRLSTLSLEGVPVAMLFAFAAGGATYLYNSGYEPEYARLAAGLLSKAYAIEDAIARGDRRFDFLRGEEDYKRRLGGVPREVLRVTLRA